MLPPTMPSLHLVASFREVFAPIVSSTSLRLMTVDSLTSPHSLSALSSSSPIASFLQSAPAIGMAWVLSSAIVTTYSTTMFLKYQQDPVEAPSFRPQTTTTTLLPTMTRNLSMVRSESSALSTARRMFVHPGLQTTLRYRLHHVLTLVSRPTLLTLYRFAGSLLLGLVLHQDFNIASRWFETLRVVRLFVLPATCLFVANMANSLALDRIGISLTYTSKCGIPLMTVLLTMLFDGVSALPNAVALLSLVPIAVGIAAASWSTPSFELLGFMAAMISTLAQALLNVTSKRAMMVTGVTGPVAQRTMVLVGLIWTLSMIVGELRQQQKTLPRKRNVLPPSWLAWMALTAYHVEYVLSFMFVKLVQPVTYGTMDAIRRLCIIWSGRAMFGGAPLTRINVIGIALALLGALSYSTATALA